MSDAGDGELVVLVQDGSKDAYNVLVQRYQHRINKVVMRYVRDQSEALDVTQDAFIKAFNAIDNFRGDCAFYTWIYRIAINTAKNHLVAKGKRFTTHLIEEIDSEHSLSKTTYKECGAPEKILQKNELEKVVLSVIEQLPSDLKTTITLRELEGLTYEEISYVMDCPIGTVRSRIFRAREAIERKMKPLFRD